MCDSSCLLLDLASLQLRASQFDAQLMHRCCFTIYEVKLTDEVSTVRFVAAQLSPFKVYRAPIVRTPGDVISREESKPAWLSGNLAMILPTRIRLLLLLVSEITQIYFSFFIRVIILLCSIYWTQ